MNLLLELVAFDFTVSLDFSVYSKSLALEVEIILFLLSCLGVILPIVSAW